MSSCICRRAGNWFVWCHLAALDLESMPFLSISMISYVFAGEHQVLDVALWCPRLYSPMLARHHGTNGCPRRPSLRNLGPQRLSLCCLHIFELCGACTRATKEQLNLETSSELPMEQFNSRVRLQFNESWANQALICHESLVFIDFIQGLSLHPPVFNHSCTLYTPRKHTAKGKPPRKSQACHVTAEEQLTWRWILWTCLNSETAGRKDGIRRCASPNWASNTAGRGTSGWMQMGGNGSANRSILQAMLDIPDIPSKKESGCVWQCVEVRNAQRLKVLVPLCYLHHVPWAINKISKWQLITKLTVSLEVNDGKRL